MSVAATLEKAAQIVEEGWTQGQYRQGDCYCPLGAIAKACGYEVVEGVAVEQKPFLSDAHFRKVVALFGATIKSVGVWTWNDRSDRTQDQVVLAMRGAAAAIRNSKHDGSQA